MVPKLTVGECAGGHRAENRRKSRDIMLQPRTFFVTYPYPSFSGSTKISISKTSGCLDVYEAGLHFICRILPIEMLRHYPLQIGKTQEIMITYILLEQF